MITTDYRPTQENIDRLLAVIEHKNEVIRKLSIRHTNAACYCEVCCEAIQDIVDELQQSYCIRQGIS